VGSTIAANGVEEKLCEVLAGVPTEAVGALLLLCRLACYGFFDCYCAGNTWRKDPKIIFTVADLKECGIEVTAEWDGYSLLVFSYYITPPIIKP